VVVGLGETDDDEDCPLFSTSKRGRAAGGKEAEDEVRVVMINMPVIVCVWDGCMFMLGIYKIG
jgi:hypothetical protein